MHKKIPGQANRIVFDEKNNRFLLLGRGAVNVFDAQTNEKLARLPCRYASQTYVSYKNKLIAIKSTIGDFVFYSAEDFSFLGKVKVRCSGNTDGDFAYDEENNVLYGILDDKHLRQYLYCVSPATFTYTTVLLPPPHCDDLEKVEPFTRYIFHKCEQDGIYLIRNFYDLGRDLPNGQSLIYESCYGRYEIEGNALVLKERYISTTEQWLELLDIVEPETAPQIREFCRNCLEGEYMAYFARTFRGKHGLYFVTSDGLYRQKERSDFEEIYHIDKEKDICMADYAEFNGRRYICTWCWCLVEDIKIKACMRKRR